MLVDNEGWLADVVVINENKDYAVASDVRIFRSVGELCAYREPWYIEEGHDHFVLTGVGKRVWLGLEKRSSWRSTWNEIVVADVSTDQPDDPETVHRWLTAMAENIQGGRRKNAEKGKLLLGDREHAGILPSTVEGSIAYIGFS